MVMYLGNIYPPRVFRYAAPSDPSFIGSKVILVTCSGVCSSSCISSQISPKIGMFMYRFGIIYPPRVFRYAASSSTSFIGLKVILVTCSFVSSTSCICSQISPKFGKMMYLGNIYPPRVFRYAAPIVPSFID